MGSDKGTDKGSVAGGVDKASDVGTATKSHRGLKLGKGGQKSRRGSTPRASLLTESNLAKFTRMSGSTSSSSSSGKPAISGNAKADAIALESLNERLRRLKEDGRVVLPFRVKFVNIKGEATMADVYPTEEFNDIIQKVTAKLRMSRHSDYVLMFTDTDNEEIGVA
ncbi:hypothetical protein GGI05_001784, partial [Coemansia sp. RSA 2603]